MFSRKKQQQPKPGTNVVAELQQQVRDAQALAAVPRQDLLDDPRLNPRTRGRADELTAQRLHSELELQHQRQLRRTREIDRVEEEQARAAHAVARAKEATDPARSVLALDRARRRYTAGALGASVVLSVGAALGVEAFAQSFGAPWGVGYLAEVAMTGMATIVIAWRGGLARAAARVSPGADHVLQALIAVPLLASIVASSLGSGPVGAICSIGAGLFAWLAYLVSRTGADAITQAVTRMDAPTRPPVQPSPEDSAPGPELASEADQHEDGPDVAVEAAQYLQQHTPPPDIGWPPPSAHLDAQGMPIPPGWHSPSVPTHHGDRAQPAQAGAQESPPEAPEESTEPELPTPAAVRAYHHTHPDQTVSEIARAFGISRRTVRRYLDERGGAR